MSPSFNSPTTNWLESLVARDAGWSWRNLFSLLYEFSALFSTKNLKNRLVWQLYRGINEHFMSIRHLQCSLFLKLTQWQISFQDLKNYVLTFDLNLPEAVKSLTKKDFLESNRGLRTCWSYFETFISYKNSNLTAIWHRWLAADWFRKNWIHRALLILAD